MSTRLHAKAEQEAHEGGGEIPSSRTEDLAGITVKGEHLGQSMLAHKLGHHLARELRHRASPRTSRCNQIEVAAATCVGDLHHMLPLALCAVLHVTFIFQIELDAPPRGRAQF
jgi:hypothetical protein